MVWICLKYRVTSLYTLLILLAFIQFLRGLEKKIETSNVPQSVGIMPAPSLVIAFVTALYSGLNSGTGLRIEKNRDFDDYIFPSSRGLATKRCLCDKITISRGDKLQGLACDLLYAKTFKLQ